MKNRNNPLSASPRQSNLDAPPPESKSASMPLVEDLARREKTPFVMTSVGRRAKNVLGWESGQTMYFSPDDPQ
jgi:hypothetical protein